MSMAPKHELAENEFKNKIENDSKLPLSGQKPV